MSLTTLDVEGWIGHATPELDDSATRRTGLSLRLLLDET